MKRIIDYYLLQWKQNSYHRKPLLLRGARQIGKTYAVRQLGTTYESFVEINLENLPKAHIAFQDSLNPQEMLTKLMAASKQEIIPGKTLLFLDEIQIVPRAIIALRYFYEQMPELHVIAAGSLLDFAIEKVGIPVGRIEALYMRPMSFIEYLAATDNHVAIQSIMNHTTDTIMQEPMHTTYIQELGTYLALGGMPESIASWIDTKNPLRIERIHASILDSYRQDFDKYAQIHQIEHVTKIFNQIPEEIGRKFNFNVIDGEYKKRELVPALDLLVTAGIAQKVYYALGQAIPLAAQSSDIDYKVIFLDCGLAQTALGLHVHDWILQPEQEIANKGSFIEAFVGQELAAYVTPHIKNDLYYWHKDHPKPAEIDYLVALHGKVIPIEVKAGFGSTLYSLDAFLTHHTKSPYGIKFSAHNYSIYHHENMYDLQSYPLYAIAQVMSNNDPEMKAAIENLISL